MFPCFCRAHVTAYFIIFDSAEKGYAQKFIKYFSNHRNISGFFRCTVYEGKKVRGKTEMAAKIEKNIFQKGTTKMPSPTGNK